LVYEWGLPTVEDKLRTAYKEYYETKHRHSKLRELFLDDLVAESNKSDKSSQLKQLRTREHQLSVAKKLNYLRGKGNMGCTTMVTVPDENGRSVDIINKGEIEKSYHEK
jgi:hypothetical protein